ncbi:hypothetical protein P0F40_003547 [Vibrio metschnikovii]|uniref:Uncharacterized protein n=3 Tax=Unclassified Bacteria TaxID=49928 RepID=A0AAU6TP09_UNCXX|nr:hypothetical protein [Vibrio metschnikovii]EKO3594237.1 hypothetical protein [Vibrio metschnikovii]EKO3643328.1 hypothetical protein [Vibrio metschnikovii]EKO3667732.1 hypothetical protein [Vibrio metschnikovii]EKO3698774.1 hypothetical protein [Vibrio metschnikovii]
MFSFGSKKVASSPLSNFVKHASSSEKKKVYKKVIVAASESQNSTIEKARAVA